MRCDRRIRFPDPKLAGEEGLLCVGGDLELETLLEAYRIGVFPWPQEGYPLLWFCPAQRGVLDFADVHWPRRFLRELRAPGYRITFDRAFGEVIRACAKAPRAHEKGTWILPEMIEAYEKLHEAGYAHSVECWSHNGESESANDSSLVGGLYGVYVDGVFSGESMFHRENGASKRCLHALIGRLREVGLEWIDIQMVTPVLKTFGGKYVSREDYLTRLQTVRERGGSPWPVS